MAVLFDQSDVIFIRFSLLYNTFLFPILIYKRLMGAKIVIDIPTPRVIYLKEMRSGTAKLYRLRIFGSYIFGPWILYPANIIIQYGEESNYSSLGLKRKTIKMGNGIHIDSSIKLIKQNKHPSTLNLIAVASLAFWHGYDRIIKAIALIKESNPGYNLSLKIVGDGDALDSLKSLTTHLGLEDQVFFTGPLYGDNLDKAYNGTHLGVASLGLSRKGTNEASDLKTREYMAQWICVLGTGKDPDFQEHSNFRYTVPNDESIEPVAEVLKSIINSDLPSPEEARDYAKNNLDLTIKLKKILDEIK